MDEWILYGLYGEIALANRNFETCSTTTSLTAPCGVSIIIAMIIMALQTRPVQQVLLLLLVAFFSEIIVEKSRKQIITNSLDSFDSIR